MKLGQEIEDLTVDLIEEFRNKLPEIEVNAFIDLAKHNECGIALENLATQIYEYYIRITVEQFEKIKSLFLQMKLKDKLALQLSELII